MFPTCRRKSSEDNDLARPIEARRKRRAPVGPGALALTIANRGPPSRPRDGACDHAPMGAAAHAPIGAAINDL
jgi:hypothetical protein